MGLWWLCAGLLPLCGLAGWWVVRQSIRSLVGSRDTEQARAVFRRVREHLEADFVRCVARAEPFEGSQWESARWGDEVVWARDRRTGHLLALVGVELENGTECGRRATAVFECRGERWVAEGRRLDAVEPSEAFDRRSDLEPLVIPLRRP